MIRSVILALALIGAPAGAAQWEFMGNSTTGTAIYIDRASLKASGNLVSVWMRLDYSRDKTENAREEKILWSCNCVEQTSATLSSIRYRADGSTISSYSRPSYSLTYEPIAPETVGEWVARRACALTESQR